MSAGCTLFLHSCAHIAFMEHNLLSYNPLGPSGTYSPYFSFPLREVEGRKGRGNVEESDSIDGWETDEEGRGEGCNHTESQSLAFILFPFRWGLLTFVYSQITISLIIWIGEKIGKNKFQVWMDLCRRDHIIMHAKRRCGSEKWANQSVRLSKPTYYSTSALWVVQVETLVIFC